MTAIEYCKKYTITRQRLESNALDPGEKESEKATSSSVKLLHGPFSLL